MFLIVWIVVILFLVILISFSPSGNRIEITFSPLESGFESLKYGSIISSSFFILAVLFVLFDVELIFLAPGVFFYSFRFLNQFIIWLVIISTILITLIIE